MQSFSCFHTASSRLLPAARAIALALALGCAALLLSSTHTSPASSQLRFENKPDAAKQDDAASTGGASASAQAKPVTEVVPEEEQFYPAKPRTEPGGARMTFDEAINALVRECDPDPRLNLF